jgi:hypothetical protein
LGERSGALRACARHHSSCATLRLRFNLPQPGVSIIRAAPQVRFAGHTVAESANALSLREAFYPRVLYIPREDVDMTVLVRSDHQTRCPTRVTPPTTRSAWTARLRRTRSGAMSSRWPTLRKLQVTWRSIPIGLTPLKNCPCEGAGNAGGNLQAAEPRGEFLIFSPIFTVFSPCSCPI